MNLPSIQNLRRNWLHAARIDHLVGYARDEDSSQSTGSHVGVRSHLKTAHNSPTFFQKILLALNTDTRGVPSLLPGRLSTPLNDKKICVIYTTFPRESQWEST